MTIGPFNSKIHVILLVLQDRVHLASVGGGVQGAISKDFIEELLEMDTEEEHTILIFKNRVFIREYTF